MTWSDRGRGKEEEETLMTKLVGMHSRQKDVVSKALTTATTQGEIQSWKWSQDTSLLPEIKAIQNPCAPCKDPDGCPPAQGKAGAELQEVFQPLGPAEGEGRSLQHPTAAWSSCRGLRRGYSVPEDEISLSQLDK